MSYNIVIVWTTPAWERKILAYWACNYVVNHLLFYVKPILFLDGQKVGHFLITIQKSFKLIFNQLWA